MIVRLPNANHVEQIAMKSLGFEFWLQVSDPNPPLRITESEIDCVHTRPSASGCTNNKYNIHSIISFLSRPTS